MIKIKNHLGTIAVSKKYVKRLVISVAESCFGVADLRAVDISSDGSSLSVRLCIAVSDGVNLPAAANSVSHKVAYVLTRKTGIRVRSVQIFTDSLFDSDI